jgi:hypothetical protein
VVAGLKELCAAAVLLTLSTQAISQSHGYWLPDSKTVARLDHMIRTLPLPTLGNWAATSIDTYGRTYTGMTLNGHRVVIDVILSTDAAHYAPGIHVVPIEKQPHAAGGLCSRLPVGFDVSENRLTDLQCYGLG